MKSCTRLTPRCDDARDYNVELRKCCRSLVYDMVKTVGVMLDDLHATWWADYGTLLGAVRNPLTTWEDYPWLSQVGRRTKGPKPGIVPHDKDADFGVMWSDWARVRRIKTKLTLAGYNVTANYVRGSMKVRVSALNHTNLDLFFWRERPDGTLFRNGYAGVDKCKGREFHKSMLQPMTTVKWEGLNLPSPADPNTFLAMRYGPEWMKPIAANNDGVPRE